MTLAKLKKQLARDIEKSPGKAAALGILILVALYAWAPLLFKSGKADVVKTNKTPATPLVETGAEAAPPVASRAAQNAPSEMPWDEVVKLIEADPLMSPVPRGVTPKNPFSRSVPELPRVADAPDAHQVLPTATNRTLSVPDLTVTSTMIGSQRRVAVIDGRPYAEGRRIRLASGDSATLAEVGVRHVVIEHSGQRFEYSVQDEIGLAEREAP